MSLINKAALERMSNFTASIVCYIIMPLTPFMFEYRYTHPHEITVRSVMIALSTFSFSTAFGTKFRIISVLLIMVGFLTGGMYGSVGPNEFATIDSLACILLYIIITLSTIEWAYRHFFEDEECLFYTIFKKNKS